MVACVFVLLDEQTEHGLLGVGNYALGTARE